MAELLTAAELMDRTPPYRDVVCEAWGGLIRVARLSGPDKLRFALRAAALEKDKAGKVHMSEPQNWAFAVDLLAACVVDSEGALQFAEHGPRAWLSGEVTAVSELLGPCMEVNGLGGTEASEVEAAKKD